MRVLAMVLVAVATLAQTQAFLSPLAQPANQLSGLLSQQTASARKGVVTMAERKCELLGKRANRACMSVSFSHRRNKKVQGVNLQEKKVWWEEGKKFVRLRLSTKGWKTIKKYGLHQAAKKFELDLHQHNV